MKVSLIKGNNLLLRFLFSSRVQGNFPSHLSASLLKTPRICTHLHHLEQIQGRWAEQLQLWWETHKVASPWRTTPTLSYLMLTASLMWEPGRECPVPTRDSWSWTAWMKTQWMPTWVSCWDCVPEFLRQRRAARVKQVTLGHRSRKSCLVCALELSHQRRWERSKEKRARGKAETSVKLPTVTWISSSDSVPENFPVQVKEATSWYIYYTEPARCHCLNLQMSVAAQIEHSDII